MQSSAMDVNASARSNRRAGHVIPAGLAHAPRYDDARHLTVRSFAFKTFSRAAGRGNKATHECVE